MATLCSSGLKRSGILKAMAVFFTAGADRVHLSAGAEDGNSG